MAYRSPTKARPTTRRPSEYHHFRQLRHSDVDPHLLDLQLERLLELDKYTAQCPSGLPNFSVIAPGVLSVTFTNDTPALASLGPAIFQLRGRGEVVWAAAATTPGWRLRELKWYADELSFLDTGDFDVIVDAAYDPSVGERARSRRVTGPSPRTVCSPEPQLKVLGPGRYSLTFPSHNGAPQWWSHPVNIDIRDEIIVNHHEDTPRWRFDEIREYVILLADIHLEAVTADPERVGSSVGGKKGTGTLRRSTWSPHAVRKPSRADSLAMQMNDLKLEPVPPTGGGRRASEPTTTLVTKQNQITEEPVEEIEAAVRGEIVGHGLFALTWFEPEAGSEPQEAWRRFPTRVQLLSSGAVLDMHEGTPSNVRRAFTAAAVDLHLRLTGVVAEVSAVFALSMPMYPMLFALLPTPEGVDPATMPPAPAHATRIVIEVHARSPPPTLPPAENLPRIALFNPPENVFTLKSPQPRDDDPVFNLMPSSGFHSHLPSVPMEELDRKAVYLYALKELIGTAEIVPPSVIDMVAHHELPLSSLASNTATPSSEIAPPPPAVSSSSPFVPSPTPSLSSPPSSTAPATSSPLASPPLTSTLSPTSASPLIPSRSPPPPSYSVSESRHEPPAVSPPPSVLSPSPAFSHLAVSPPTIQMESEVIGIGTIDVMFPALDHIKVRVYFMDDEEYLFELSDNTNISRVAELGSSLELGLGAEIEAWTNVKAMVRAYAPHLDPSALVPHLPDVEHGKARLAFTPRVRRPSLTPSSNSRTTFADLPTLQLRQQGIYHLEWPANSGIPTTTYDIRNGRIGIFAPRTPNSCMVLWLGVAIRALFENNNTTTAPPQPPQLYNARRSSAFISPVAFPDPQVQRPASPDTPPLSAGGPAQITLSYPAREHFPTPHAAPVAQQQWTNPTTVRFATNGHGGIASTATSSPVSGRPLSLPPHSNLSHRSSNLSISSTAAVVSPMQPWVNGDGKISGEFHRNRY